MRFLKQITKEKVKTWVKKLLHLLFNPRLLLCLFLGWMITNGWSYILLFFGLFFKITWMQAVAGAYLGLLWIPFTPEKILTVALAILLLRLLFPKDEKTLGVLREMIQRERSRHKKRKRNREELKRLREERGKSRTEGCEFE